MTVLHWLESLDLVCKILPRCGLGTTEMQKPQPLPSLLTKKIFLGQEKSHLVTSDVKPCYVFMQCHDLVNHGFDQCPRLLLVWVEGVGKHLHLPEMSKLLVLQHELQEKGELGEQPPTEGDSSVLLCHQGSADSHPAILAVWGQGTV